MIQPVQVALGDKHPGARYNCLLTALKQLIRDITAHHWYMPFCPNQQRTLVLKPSTTVIRILIDVLPVQGHYAANGVRLPRPDPPFATTALLATPADIIELE